MTEQSYRSLAELPRRHLLIGASADSTFGATIVYAIATHLARFPVLWAAAIAGTGAVISFSVLAWAIVRDRFNPQPGTTLIQASPRTIGYISALMALLALVSLGRGPVEGTYLPMLATICCASLAVSSARIAKSGSGLVPKERSE